MLNSVFTKSPCYEIDGKRYYLVKYYPVRHPEFKKSVLSKLILDVKENKDSAINYFTHLLNKTLDKGFTIAVVPSSDPKKTVTGMTQIANRLGNQGFIDASSCLHRHTQVPKKATGGSRNIDIDINSIEVKNVHLIKGKTIILLDDITTTGGSFDACEQLLLQAGAIKVVKLALGKTASY